MLYIILITIKKKVGDIMYKAYRFRMYPNNDQIILINKNFGCVRFVYNYFLYNYF